MPTRSAQATWTGDLKGGKGEFKGQSGAISGGYSFGTRFENAPGTNPEELIGAAHAGCFSMALSAQLGTENKTAESIETEAEVTLLKTDAGFTVTAVHLKVRAKVPGATPPDFLQAAEAAKANCPISRLLKAEITMEARLAGWT